MTELFNAGEAIEAFKVHLDAIDGDVEPEWSGPEVEWTCGLLGATTPPPQVAFDHCYLDDNGIEVDGEYVLRSLWALGVEQGYRIASTERVDRYDVYRHLENLYEILPPPALRTMNERLIMEQIRELRNLLFPRGAAVTSSRDEQPTSVAEDS